MGRSRRLSKKLHRKYLTDVLYGVSTSHVWRARLLEAAPGTEFAIDAAAFEDVPAPVVAELRRYGLRYAAAQVPHAWTRGWAGYEAYVMFRVRASGFPDVAAYSANNPATIYGQPRVTPG